MHACQAACHSNLHSTKQWFPFQLVSFCAQIPLEHSWSEKLGNAMGTGQPLKDNKVVLSRSEILGGRRDIAKMCQNTCWLGKTLSQQSKVNEDEDPLPLQVPDPCIYKSQQRDSSSPRDECWREKTQHEGTMPKNNNKKTHTPKTKTKHNEEKTQPAFQFRSMLNSKCKASRR